ncbi:protein lethal(2)essential for life-like [Aricia agestis]|uniref:protein lethal(2)essential for life-like n=1 Tax=Aricia agestis TaxID=91739 RepID=UPI001C2016D7|nr:protein lethal(2)essential for life-like [Aricia agestis]
MSKLLHLFYIALLLSFINCEEECPEKKKENQKRLFDQDFGLALTPDDLFHTMISPWMVRDYFRPWRYLESLTRDLGSSIKTENNKFTINLDVQHFAPDEITVKTADGYVTVQAKHEEKKDEHGYISRQFSRRYALPEGVESEEVVSQLSSDGILTISAPRKVDEKGERVVPITQTGPARTEKTDSESCPANEKCSV